VAWAEGAALSTKEAIAYAQRGRDERKQPTSGWASVILGRLRHPWQAISSRSWAKGLDRRSRDQSGAAAAWERIWEQNMVKLMQKSATRRNTMDG
jgi:hypothetical protein